MCCGRDILWWYSRDDRRNKYPCSYKIRCLYFSVLWCPLYNVPVADVRWQLTLFIKCPLLYVSCQGICISGIVSIHCLHCATCRACPRVISLTRPIFFESFDLGEVVPRRYRTAESNSNERIHNNPPLSYGDERSRPRSVQSQSKNHATTDNQIRQKKPKKNRVSLLLSL